MNLTNIDFDKVNYWGLPILYLIGYICTEWLKNPWLLVMFFYFLLPLLDKYYPLDEFNPSLE